MMRAGRADHIAWGAESVGGCIVGTIALYNMQGASQIAPVQVPVCAHCLVQVLLLLELGLPLLDALLQVNDGHLPQLDLLQRRHVPAVHARGTG